MLLKILKPHDKETVKQYIDKLPDKKFSVEIKQKREIRTVSQNALYWLWLTCIMAEPGNDKDYLHIFFGKKYLPQNSRVIYGETVNITVSTTSLDTAQFAHYLERIQQFANSELGIVLPNPEDLHFKEFYETYKDFI
jgi:hypothetical protein